MGKITAFLLLLMFIIQSPVFACALQVKVDQAALLFADTGSGQQDTDQDQDLDQHGHFDNDESDDFKLPVCRIGWVLPYHKNTKNLSGQYLLARVAQQNFSVNTPPPEC